MRNLISAAVFWPFAWPSRKFSCSSMRCLAYAMLVGLIASVSLACGSDPPLARERSEREDRSAPTAAPSNADRSLGSALRSSILNWDRSAGRTYVPEILGTKVFAAGSMEDLEPYFSARGGRWLTLDSMFDEAADVFAELPQDGRVFQPDTPVVVSVVMFDCRPTGNIRLEGTTRLIDETVPGDPFVMYERQFSIVRRQDTDGFTVTTSSGRGCMDNLNTGAPVGGWEPGPYRVEYRDESGYLLVAIPFKVAGFTSSKPATSVGAATDTVKAAIPGISPTPTRAVQDGFFAGVLSGRLASSETGSQPSDLAADYNESGMAYLNSGEYKRAIEEFDRAIAHNPDYSPAYNNRGLAYGELGRNERAIEDFDRAIARDPANALAYYNRGRTYHGLGQYERAIEDYDLAIRVNPNSDSAYNNRGDAYHGLGQYERAIQDRNRAIELNPNNAITYNNRGSSYYELGNYQRAIEDYDRAIAINPEHAVAYLGRGNCHHSLIEYRRAIEDFNLAIRYASDTHVSSVAHNDRGVAYFALDQYEKALSDFERSIALDPDYEIARLNRADVLGFLGR